MTSMSDATRKAMVTLGAARDRPPPPPAPVSTRLFSMPAISPELSRELDRVMAGPIVLTGDDRDNDRMILHRMADWQPGADEAAEQLRAGLDYPAPPEVIEEWLATLSVMVANAPTEPDALDQRCAAVWRLCGQLPAAVWSDESVDAYCDQSSFWPVPADLRQFLQARVTVLRKRLAGFEKIAKAPKSPPPPARKSTVPYNPPAYLTDQRERPQPAPPKIEVHDKVSHSLEEQVQAVGGAGDTDLLKARLRLYQPQGKEP